MLTVLIGIAFITVTQLSEMALSHEQQICKNLSVSCRDFTNQFHKTFSTTTEGNLVSSPLGIHLILSLLSHGSGGATLDEFISGLCHRNRDSLNDEFKTLILTLNDVKNVKLYIANAMYIQDGFEVSSDFVSTGTNVFRSLISKLDFNNKVDAATKINDWVKKTTNEKISNIVSSDDFDEYTKLVLLNGIYFKGPWLHAFDTKETQKKVFHVTKGETRLVPTMFRKSRYHHGELPNLHARFIEIPYLNEDIAMIIILPNEIDGLRSLEENFEWKALAEAPRDWDTFELYLPKFKFEVTINLEDILRKIGLNTMFEDNADFSGISHVALKVSKAVHKAVIEVNEEGTEAAAATVVVMRERRMIMEPEEFLVDHPFMFLIEHKPSNVPLFVGSVRDIKAPPERDEL